MACRPGLGAVEKRGNYKHVHDFLVKDVVVEVQHLEACKGWLG